MVFGRRIWLLIITLILDKHLVMNHVERFHLCSSPASLSGVSFLYKKSNQINSPELMNSDPPPRFVTPTLLLLPSHSRPAPPPSVAILQSPLLPYRPPALQPWRCRALNPPPTRPLRSSRLSRRSPLPGSLPSPRALSIPAPRLRGSASPLVVGSDHHKACEIISTIITSLQISKLKCVDLRHSISEI